MPEKGWAILTVREDTARRVKELAHTKGLTVDEFVNQLMNPAGRMDGAYAAYVGQKLKPKTSMST